MLKAGHFCQVTVAFMAIFFDFSSPKIHMTQRALGWVAQAGACMGELAP